MQFTNKKKHKENKKKQIDENSQHRAFVKIYHRTKIKFKKKKKETKSVNFLYPCLKEKNRTYRCRDFLHKKLKCKKNQKPIEYWEFENKILEKEKNFNEFFILSMECSEMQIVAPAAAAETEPPAKNWKTSRIESTAAKFEKFENSTTKPAMPKPVSTPSEPTEFRWRNQATIGLLMIAIVALDFEFHAPNPIDVGAIPFVVNLRCSARPLKQLVAKFLRLPLQA